MGIILGFLCLFCLVLLLVKAITNKFQLEKADNLLMKMHKYICGTFIISSLLHLIFVFPVFRTRSLYILVSGMAAVIIFLLIIIHFHIRGKKEKKWLLWHRLFSAALLLCIIIHMISYYVDYNAYSARIENIHLSEVNTTWAGDGQYIGEYDAGYIYAKVRVTVKDGILQKIDILEHRNERGQAAEQIIKEIADTGKFPVDAVSGATNSSKVIQQAIQNALKGDRI